MEPTKSSSLSSVFTWFMILCTIVIVYFMWSSGQIITEALSANVTAILIKIALWIFCVKFLEFFSRGIGNNVQDEIYGQNNTAAAQYEIAMKIGLAIVIAGAG